jgi:DNA helicase II / ATP-dependent DNA helicase PcrA
MVIDLKLEEYLNPEQLDAVRTSLGPLLILAGAGSGKTRVLTHRISHLIAEGLARPDEILAVTFTNKAAGEMKDRIKGLIPGINLPFVGTFHSFCARFLRQHLENGRRDRNFVIYDEGDRKAVVREVLKDLNIDEKMMTPWKVIGAIGRAKNKYIDPETFALQNNDYESRMMYDAYALYEEKMRAYNAVDFDDLLMVTVKLLKNDPKLLAMYGKKFRYILVDEYQDINYVQYILLHELAQFHRNLTVVGDDDQSIYGFRGAEMAILLKFQEDFPEATIIKLEQNYRSTKIILDAANYLMVKNKMRHPKNLWTERQGGEKIGYFRAADGRGEARFAALKILEMVRNKQYSYRDFAVLYRTNAQSRLFEEAFIQEGIPYNLIGSLKFYDRKEIKDLLAYLRLVINPVDAVSLRRIINVPPRGVGDATLRKLDELCRQGNISLLEGMRTFSQSKEGTATARKKLAGLLEIIDIASESMNYLPGSEILEKIISMTGYREFILDDGRAEGVAREENVNELINVVKEFEGIAEDHSLGAFLNNVSLITDIDCWNDEEGKVSLMTLHLTKGLEFPVVFLTGLEEKLLPHSMSMDNDNDIEEERRLCYVGITRAMNKLFCSHAELRFDRGIREERKVSRFLLDIPMTLLVTYDPKKKSGSYRAPVTRFSDSHLPERIGNPFHAGDAVSHTIFGAGQVVEVSGDAVTVHFADRGQKKIMSEFLQRKAQLPDEKLSHYQKGDRVEHKEYGSGVVCSVDPDGSWALVIFHRIGTRRVALAELEGKPENRGDGHGSSA